MTELAPEITALLGCERMTLYTVDTANRELSSLFKTGEQQGTIRVPLDANSLAGYAALRQKALNIANAYDQAELTTHDPELRFFEGQDRLNGFLTRQVLVVPVTFKQYLFGVLQFLNKRGEAKFSQRDEHVARELAVVLGQAMYGEGQRRVTRSTRFDHLIELGMISTEDLAEAIAAARRRGMTVEQVLMDQYKVPKKDLLAALGAYFGVPALDFDNNIVPPVELLRKLKTSYLQHHLWVPLGEEQDEIIILIDNPHDLRRKDIIASLFPNRALRYAVGLREDILAFLALFSGVRQQVGHIDAIMRQLEGEEKKGEGGDEDQIDESNSGVVQLVNRSILDAYERGASDIHIEPSTGRKLVRVRLRIDGDCLEYQDVPYNFRHAIVSRIKIMANLDITERRKPQDGKIVFKKLFGRNIELRVATVPTQGGVEDVVMRILAAGEPIPLERLGLSASNEARLKSCIVKPYGLFFVCGPTGSGKTTTLHSILRELNTEDRKIWTAEDPVEITQEGLRQVQVHPGIGFTFAAAMRSFLRCDPDIIMVGEMRDSETTHTGIEASLTGHLVFSTLHTNSAPESITRLLDIGMDPFNFADAMLGILAQRLVKVLCKECKRAYRPSQEELGLLAGEYGEEEFARDFPANRLASLELYQAVGCKHCEGTGYRGRLGLHELLIGTPLLKQMIQRRTPIDELRLQARNDGMRTLLQDGVAKVLAGSTDLVQVKRVCIQ